MNLNMFAKRVLPGFQSRLFVRRVLSFPRDTFDSLTGRRDPLIPPHGLWFVGGERNYELVNEEFLRYFVEFGGLQPSSRVLDVGCGLGVMAARLTRFLQPSGSYCGMDIVKVGVEWAQRNIASRFPNFSFVHADVYNKHYNPKGKVLPEQFSFPFPDREFDFIIVKSVFTHLLPETVRQYLREIRRVMRPGSRCLATAFLLNQESLKLIGSGHSSIHLSHRLDGCRVVDPSFPETAVGLPEEEFLQWCRQIGISVQLPVHYGAWCGRDQFMSYQDIVVLG